jgi:hypothetical protein
MDSLLTDATIISATFAEVFESTQKNKNATEILGEHSPELNM